VRRKLACDLFYVHRTSLLLDVRILLSTDYTWRVSRFESPASCSTYRAVSSSNGSMRVWKHTR
jgi:hypothetical protein